MRIAFLLLALCCLCSCSFDRRPAQIRCEPITQFSCRADCTQGENSFSFLVEADNGKIKMQVLEPENLTGVSFSSDSSDSITADANGMTDIFPIASFTEKSPVRLLMQGIRTFLFTGTETLTSMPDGTYTSQQTADGTNATGVFSADGQLLRLQYPVLETVFVFSEYN